MTSKDIISGLVTPVVVVTATLSYAALIFSGPLAGGLPVGLGFGLMGAGVMAILFAALSGIPFAVAGPDSKPSSVLATLGALTAASMPHGPGAESTVMVVLIGGTLLTGVALYLFGLLKMGRWIRFIPYPVVGGFMAASGWLLMTGGVRVVTGVHVSLATVGEILTGRRLPQLGCAILFALALHFLRRIKSPFAFPLFLAVAVGLFHIGLTAAGMSPIAAHASGWLMDAGRGAIISLPWIDGSLSGFDPALLWKSAGAYIALIAVTAITLLLSVMAVELQARMDIDIDKELRLNGLANLLVGVLGGMPGTLSVSRTLFNFQAGARHRISGLLTGAVCLAMLGFGTSALGFVPVPLLGGLLIQLGAAMVMEWLAKGVRRLPWADGMQVVFILVAIVQWDFIAGVAVGVMAACVTFAVNTGRVRLVKLGLSRSEFASRVDRPPHQREILSRYGDGIQILWLHGFIFFGSATRLLAHVRTMLAGHGRGKCHSVILDLRQVLGIDSSAVLNLVKLRHLAEREGFRIALASPPAAVEAMLRAGGFVTEPNDQVVEIFPDLDAALEASEETLLGVHAGTGDQDPSGDDWLVAELGSAALMDRLRAYLELRDYQAGDHVFRQGEPGEALYLLGSGRVSILFQPAEGPVLRLRSMLCHTMVGEMGLYRLQPTGASVKVDADARAWRLSRAAMARMEAEDPELAYAFHKFIIRTLASRLDFANREIAGLQR